MAGILEFATANLEKVISLTLQHFTMFLISISFALVIGGMLGIWATGEGRQRLGRALLSITGAAQAVPSIAVVALVFIFVGIGPKPAIISLVVYSLVPIVFNTTSGILSVPGDVVEAARGMGLTESQILWKVKIRIALPVIMAGIRSAATINIGTATVATVIGGGGLGDLIMTGLKLNKFDMILIGAILSASMAIVVDTILAFVESRVTPKGLSLERAQ